MARQIEFEFPFGGHGRRTGYPQKEKPYTTAYSQNCRGFDSYERRLRGGSRPPLAKYIATDLGDDIRGIERVSYIDASGDHQTDLVILVDGLLKTLQGSTIATNTGYLELEDGSGYILTEAGDHIYFENTVAAVNTITDTGGYNLKEHEGKVYIAGSDLTVFDPKTGIVDEVENAPSDQPLIESYLGRIVLSGEDHLFYMSRMGHPDEWDFGDDGRNQGIAVAGVTGDQSKIGGDITCVKAWEDKALLIATEDDLWVYYGDPVGGEKQCVSHEFGIIDNYAVTITDDGLVIFLSRKGVFLWQIGSKSAPKPFSERSEPEELRDIDTSSNFITMAWDKSENGAYLFITPSAATVGEHWFLEMETRAFWRSVYTQTHQPYAVSTLPISGDSQVLLGCKDGYLRRHVHSGTNDDGSALTSHALIGPIQLGGKYGKTGQITELFGDLASGSGAVTWRIVVGDTAEQCIDNAVSDIEGGTTTYVHSSGTLAANHNRFKHPRARGAWMVLWLTSSVRWAYDKMSGKISPKGKLR